MFASSGRKLVLLSKYLTPSLTVRGKCTLVATKLDSRSLVCVRGQDSTAFLQGLITNDISHLETRPAIYTLFLNHQGRVLYDAILYSGEKVGETLIECDSSLKTLLMKHLNLFRVRKKVEITDGSELKQNVWVIFDPAHKYVSNNIVDISSTVPNRQIDYEVCCRPVANHSSKRQELPLGKGIEGIGDPRVEELGWRVFLSSDNPSSPKDLPQGIQVLPEEQGYIQLRYALGIGEGASDLPPANCFPLESNGDYLHGVSFQKGCYIGQELTARTHHTGVVRKRLMPFRLSSVSSVPPDYLTPTTQLVGLGGKNIGKVRGIQNSYGLFLGRIDEALNSAEIKLGDHLVTVEKPLWWPIEASKESQAGKKMEEDPKGSTVKDKVTDKEPQQQQRVKITFECSLCELKEKCDYFGRAPPFCKSIVFHEDSYIMRDPFSASSDNNLNFLLLGGNCAICERPVCQECSIFYTGRICADCSKHKINLLPEELRKKKNKVEK